MGFFSKLGHALKVALPVAIDGIEALNGQTIGGKKISIKELNDQTVRDAVDRFKDRLRKPPAGPAMR